MLLTTTLEFLNHWDQQLFLLINKSGNAFLDQLLPIWRDKKTWIPLYVLMLVVVIYRFKKQAIPWIICIIATVAFADIISSHFFKPGFGRLRPCQDGSGIAHLMLLRLPNCPGNGSFTSSHAANHFALAFYLFFTLKKYLKNYVWLFILWATVICWAQIYVGVHYPGDILGGAILGFALAKIFTFVYLKINKKYFYKTIVHEPKIT